jgi:beta-lactamase superfamily II metal-dependent hydrolase
MAGEIRYIRASGTNPKDFATPLELVGGGKISLLWGDRVRVTEDGPTKSKVKARGREGFVKTAALSTKSLLELYFIDVGQGDGVLVRTPDDRHVLIDGGYLRKSQPSGKNAADFVDWKFFKDYAGKKRGDDGSGVSIKLDAMIASHCDADHYGGLWDLMNSSLAVRAELDSQGPLEVGAFYHAGVGWHVMPNNRRGLGEVVVDSNHAYLTWLMGDRTEVGASLAPGAARRLQGDWAKFMASVVNNGCPVRRLSDRDQYLPGFKPADGPASIRVLAPVEFTVNGAPALRSLGNDSQNTNGNSILLRLDYGRARIMLTGDLNANAQRVLLEQYQGQMLELQCDVAKGCHHGSDDVSYQFLAAMSPSATIISSGDAEGHGHPRPAIVATSALTGHVQITDDRVVTPLVYSTEIARSYRLGGIRRINVGAGPVPATVITPASNAVFHYSEKRPDSIQPQAGQSPFTEQSHLVSGIVYGLVNVRTDGETIMCATMNEGDQSWDIRTFSSRF